MIQTIISHPRARLRACAAFLVALILLAAPQSARRPAEAQGSADQVVALVNALRASLGRAAADLLTDLAAVDEAEALMAAADDAQKALRSVETQKVQAKGAYRAVGLRTTWIATLDEGGGGKALKHYAQNAPERVKAFLQELADQDVKDGVRTIPGFTITPERKV